MSDTRGLKQDLMRDLLYYYYDDDDVCLWSAATTLS